ncbi:MAG: metalloregulator ArsR/SmtB family transcription factor [Bdellovibrionota bacterium]|nr:MAG: ArsR family transcriptional regulator [Pseudomonadota bacterium]
MRDHLSQTFQALADPTRRALLAELAQGEANISDLSKPFLKKLSQPAITKHLKVLEQAGLIRKTKDAQWRNCSIKVEPLQVASSWIDQYRELWEQSLDRLGDYLDDMQTVERKAKGKKDE